MMKRFCLALLLLLLLSPAVWGQPGAKVLDPVPGARPPAPVRCQGVVNNPDLCGGSDYYYGVGFLGSQPGASAYTPAAALGGVPGYASNKRPAPQQRSPELHGYRAEPSRPWRFQRHAFSRSEENN